MMIGNNVPFYGISQSSFLPYRCDSLMKLKSKLDTLRGYLKDTSNFKKIYRYAFDFCRVRVHFNAESYYFLSSNLNSLLSSTISTFPLPYYLATIPF